MNYIQNMIAVVRKSGPKSFDLFFLLAVLALLLILNYLITL
jgi:hypothetical protein